jgi:exodeoxyribonuclease VII large subunit
LSQEAILRFKTELKDTIFKLNTVLNKKLNIHQRELTLLSGQFRHQIRNHFSKTTTALDKSGLRVSHSCKTAIQEQKHLLKQSHILFYSELQLNLKNHQNSLVLLEQKLSLSDPSVILKKGFSLTIHNGKPVSDSEELKPGDEIETFYHKGKSTSTIK